GGGQGPRGKVGKTGKKKTPTAELGKKTPNGGNKGALPGEGRKPRRTKGGGRGKAGAPGTGERRKKTEGATPATGEQRRAAAGAEGDRGETAPGASPAAGGTSGAAARTRCARSLRQSRRRICSCEDFGCLRQARGRCGRHNPSPTAPARSHR